MFNFGRAAKAEMPALRGETVTARLNARVQPIARGEYFEDPLAETLESEDLGEVAGGGTQLAGEPYGIEFCDIEIRLNEASAPALARVIARLEALGAPKGSKLIVEATGREVAFGAFEGLAIFMNGVDLPDAVYADCDINHVVAELDRLIGKGAFRGYWEGARDTVLYCYGPSFADMAMAIAPLLKGYPLCAGARVEQIA